MTKVTHSSPGPSLRCWALAIVPVLWLLIGMAFAAPLDIEPAFPATFTGPEEGPFEARFGVDRYKSTTGATTTTMQSSGDAGSSSSAGISAAAERRLLTTDRTLVRQTVPPRPGELSREVRLVRDPLREHLLRVEVVRRAPKRNTPPGDEEIVAAMAARHVVVRLRPGVTLEAAEAAARPLGITRLRRLGSSDSCIAELTDEAVQAVPEALERLAAATTHFSYAEPDSLISIEATPVNDTFFAELWGLHNTGQTGGTAGADINALKAWDLQRGDRSILVGVIDTGIDYTHPDLAAQMWVNPGEIAGNGQDDDLNGYVDDVHGYNFVNNTGTPFDDHSHGTHVAGTIGAIANNNRGVVGVTHQVSLVAIKFLDASGSGLISDAARAIDYSIAIGCDITNNSWGGAENSQTLREAMERARDAGQIVVVAAGNSNKNLNVSSDYPAKYAYPNMVKVAATDHRDQLASFSNYGTEYVDLGAPGVSILSTTPGNTYSYKSGTSMAAPHVAGALVLLKAHFPDHSYDRLINRLLGTTTPLTSLDNKVRTEGRLDLYRALSHAPPELMTLSNSTAAPVEWTLVSGIPWLTTSMTTGVIAPGASSTITLSINAQAKSLTTGTYQETFTIITSDPSGTHAIPRPVVLTVTGFPGGHLALTPTTPIDSSGPTGGPIRPLTYTYSLVNPGNTEITVSAAPSVSWLKLTTTDYTIPPGGSREMHVTIDGDSLPVGIYNGNINLANITNGRGNKQIGATLQIVQPGAMSVSPISGLNSSGNVGGPFTPSQRSYTIFNHSDVPLEWHVTSPANWITFSRTSGQLPKASSIDVEVRLNALAATLPRGDHVATINFLNNKGLGQTTRYVTLVVSAPPVLAISPTTNITAGGLPGGPFTPQTTTLTLSNQGDPLLAWGALVDVPWVSLSAYQGSLEGGQSMTLTAAINSAANALPVGTYVGRLGFTNHTNGSGSANRFITLTVQRPAQLAVYPPDGLTARGMAGEAPTPGTKTWHCTNLGDEPMQLAFAADQGWIYAPTDTWTLAAGETREVTVALTETHLLAPGDHAGTLTLSNLTNGQGNTTRPISLSLKEQATHAIYSVSIRGGRHGDGSEAINRTGYLLIDRESKLMSSVVGWRHASSNEKLFAVEKLSHEHAITYNFIYGQKRFEFLTLLDLAGNATGLQRLTTQQLHGAMEGPFDVGGDTMLTLPLQYTGHGYASRSEDRVVEIATIVARLLVADTRAANDAAKSHDQLVSQYAATVSSLGFRQLTTEMTSTPPAATSQAPGPVLVYNWRHQLHEYSQLGQRSLDRPGWMVVDAATGATAVIAGWNQDGRKVFDVTDWARDQTQHYTVELAGSRAQILDLLRRDSIDSKPRASLYRFAGGGARLAHVGGGHVVDLALLLNGTIRSDNSSAGMYGVGTVRADINGKQTLSMNARNFSLDDAVNELVGLLLGSGWQPVVDDEEGVPGR